MQSAATQSPTQPVPLDVAIAEAGLDLAVYEPGIPEPAPPIAQADADEARKMVCPICRKRAMSYRPFVRIRGPHTYRGFARCRECGHTEAL